MIVCICKGITDQQIANLVDDGATSAHEVIESCHAGKDCGTCVFKVNKLVRQKVSENAQETSSPAAVGRVSRG